MKKLFALLLCVALLGCLAAGCGSDTPEATTTGKTPTQEATEAGPMTARHLGINVMELMEQLEYPAYYGGCYVDPEANACVILVTDVEQAKADLAATLNHWEESCYRFEEATVAYKELLAVQEQVTGLIDQLAAQGVQVSSTYVGAGYVTVGIVELDDAREQAFRQLLDSPLIRLQNSPGVSLDEESPIE